MRILYSGSLTERKGWTFGRVVCGGGETARACSSQRFGKRSVRAEMRETQVHRDRVIFQGFMDWDALPNSYAKQTAGRAVEEHRWALVAGGWLGNARHRDGPNGCCYRLLRTGNGWIVEAGSVMPWLNTR